MPVILGILTILLFACEGKPELPAKKVPIHTDDKSKDGDQIVDKNPDKDKDKTDKDKDKDTDSDKDKMEIGWSLTSPEPGSSSTDVTPLIRGVGLKDFAASEATIYSDSACSQSLGSGEISKDGFIEFTNIRFALKGSDGLKSFYVKTTGGKKAIECQDLKLSYTLKTDTPFAKANAYRLSFNDDPSSKISIGFNAANSSKTETKVYFDTDDHGRDTKSYTFSKTLDVNKAMLGMNNAFARLTGLQPDTLYYFVVEDPSGVSPTYSFRTLPDNPDKKLSIIAGGDSRNNRAPRKAANLLVAKLRPHVVMFGGDMTSLGTANEWKEWFEDWQATIAEDGRMTPIIATRGNHEGSNEILETLFDTPPGVYYALNLGGNLVRVYTLNTEASISGTQTTWLKNDLSSQNATWRFVQYHHPMRAHVKDKVEGTSQYSNWAQLFYQYKVNVVVESDSHTVKSTWPLKPSSSSKAVEGFERDDENGTVYLGEGCWGAPLRNADDVKTWTRDSGAFNHFNWLIVDKNQVEVKTIKVDNASEVGSNTDSDIFRSPEKLDIWAPKNGSVIKIAKY